MRTTLSLLLFVVFGSCQLLIAQSVTLKGTILTEDQEPVPYATIYSKKSQVGTVSNLSGIFEFTLKLIDADTLVVSHVGFERYVTPVKTKESNLTIVLKESVITLEEVSVLPPEYLNNPNRIVKTAIQRTSSFNNSEKFVLNGFYRQTDIQDGQYTRLVESDISILDYGYGNQRDPIFAINQVRRSYDYRKSSGDATVEKQDTYRSRQLNCWFKYNFNRSASVNTNKWGVNNCGSYDFGLLDQSFLKEHKFKLDSITELDGELVYQIKILPNKSSKPYHSFPKSLILPVGKIYIRTDDFAIMRMEYSYILNPRKSSTTDFDIVSTVYGSMIIFKVVAIYKEFKDKVYLAYLKSEHYHSIDRKNRALRAEESDKVYNLLSRELLVNEIIEDASASLTQNIEAHAVLNVNSVNFSYDEKFWENYNYLIETADEQKLRSDLEKNTSLEDQYKNDQ